MRTVIITSDGFDYQLNINDDNPEVHTVEVCALVEGCKPQIVGTATMDHNFESVDYTYQDLGHVTDEGSFNYFNMDSIELIGEWIAGTYWQ